MDIEFGEIKQLMFNQLLDSLTPEPNPSPQIPRVLLVHCHRPKSVFMLSYSPQPIFKPLTSSEKALQHYFGREA